MRTEIERRPLLIALAGLVIGLTTPIYGANLGFLVLGLIALRGVAPRMALALGFAVGALLAPGLPRQIVADTPIDASFTVASAPTPQPGGGSVFLTSREGMTLEVATPSLVPVLGDEVLVRGTARPLPQERERTYLARGVSGVVRGRTATVTVTRRAVGLAAWGGAWRQSFVGFCRRRLAPADGGVASALAFDVRTDLSPTTRTALEQSGTVHILAASGLHIFALGWLLELLSSKLPVPLLVRRTFILCLLALYSSAGGFHPGTFRAVVSTAARDGAMVVGREYDALSAIGVAGLLYLLWRPTMVYDAGFQLSMVLGAGIAIFRMHTAGLPSLARLVRSGLVGWVVSIPIVAHLFGIVSVVSIPANLAATALLPPCLLCLLLGHVLSFVSTTASDIVLVPATIAAHEMYNLVRFFGGGRWWGFTVPEFSGYWLTAIYGFAALLWRPKARGSG